MFHWLGIFILLRREKHQKRIVSVFQSRCMPLLYHTAVYKLYSHTHRNTHKERDNCRTALSAPRRSSGPLFMNYGHVDSLDQARAWKTWQMRADLVENGYIRYVLCCSAIVPGILYRHCCCCCCCCACAAYLQAK